MLQAAFFSVAGRGFPRTAAASVRRGTRPVGQAQSFPSAKRDGRRALTSMRGSAPRTSAATTSPTAGESLKPWPLQASARCRPSTPGASPMIGFQSGE